MKIIASLQGSAGFTASVDEVLPEKGALMRDIIRIIGNRYEFRGLPDLPEGGMPAPFLSFRSGFLIDDKSEKIAVSVFNLIGNGALATTRNTDYSELFLKDYMVTMDEILKYKFSDTELKYVFQSNLVVEFEEGFESVIDGLLKLQNAINREVPNAVPLLIKRIAFGHEEPLSANPLSLEAIEKGDFLIERRAGESFGSNRFMCQAPLRTGDHIAALERIEAALR